MWMMLQDKISDDYIIATNKSHTLKYLLEIAFNTVGISNYKDYIKINPEFIRPNEVDNLKGDYSKIKNKLGWEPKTSFEDMIKLMVNNDLKLLQ
jgi:GDPmannose 4,6-dehydratase